MSNNEQLSGERENAICRVGEPLVLEINGEEFQRFDHYISEQDIEAEMLRIHGTPEQLDLFDNNKTEIPTAKVLNGGRMPTSYPYPNPFKNEHTYTTRTGDDKVYQVNSGTADGLWLYDVSYLENDGKYVSRREDKPKAETTTTTIQKLRNRIGL